MIDKQHGLILRMVQSGSVRRYENLLRVEYFNEYYREIYEALVLYEVQFSKCMSPDTFRTQWPDFEWADIAEDVEWYADEVKESYLEAQGTAFTEEFTEALKLHPSEAMKLGMQRLAAFQPYLSQNLRGVGLFAHRAERVAEARRKKRIEGLPGATFGIEPLDEITNGIQPGEIELICARPGNSKSLMLLYSGFKAFEQGKRVSIISPEMSRKEFGIRLDSFHLHLSAFRVMGGKLTPEELDWYEEKALTWKEEYQGDINFYEAEGRGKFTTADVRAIIDQDAPDVLLLDGLLLVEPMKTGRDVRLNLVNLCDELKEIVTEKQIALRAAHQVNRQSENNYSKRKSNDENALEMIPELHHLAESGATEQYANRVFCQKLFAHRLYIAVRKNRNAPEGRIVSFHYDIDRGYLSDFRLEGAEAASDDDTQMELPDDDVPF